MSVKNSSRVFGSSRNTPNIVLVTVLLFIFCTPRMTIHICLEEMRGESINQAYAKERSNPTKRDVSYTVTLNSGEVTKPPYPDWTSVSGTSAVLYGKESQIPSPWVLPSLLRSEENPTFPRRILIMGTCLSLVPRFALLEEVEGELRQSTDPVQLGQLTALPVATSLQWTREAPHFKWLQPTRPFR